MIVILYLTLWLYIVFHNDFKSLNVNLYLTNVTLYLTNNVALKTTTATFFSYCNCEFLYHNWKSHIVTFYLTSFLILNSQLPFLIFYSETETSFTYSKILLFLKTFMEHSCGLPEDFCFQTYIMLRKCICVPHAIWINNVFHLREMPAHLRHR